MNQSQRDSLFSTEDVILRTVGSPRLSRVHITSIVEARAWTWSKFKYAEYTYEPLLRWVWMKIQKVKDHMMCWPARCSEQLSNLINPLVEFSLYGGYGVRYPENRLHIYAGGAESTCKGASYPCRVRVQAIFCSCSALGASIRVKFAEIRERW